MNRADFHREASELSAKLFRRGVAGSPLKIDWPKGSRSDWIIEFIRLKRLDKEQDDVAPVKTKKRKIKKKKTQDPTKRPAFVAEGPRAFIPLTSEQQAARDRRRAREAREQRLADSEAKTRVRSAALIKSKNRMDVSTSANKITFLINDFGIVGDRVRDAIKEFGKKFINQKVAIIGEITSENGDITSSNPSRQHRRQRQFERNVNQFNIALSDHINRYETIWSSEQDDQLLESVGAAGDPIHVERIVVTFSPIINAAPPAVALSDDKTINCLIKCIYDQTKRKKVLKENIESLSNDGFIDCWDYLEDKYQCRITILDYEDNFWRVSTKQFPRKKYQPDVIVRLHNYHVEALSPKKRKNIFGRIKSVELDHRLVDGILHAKKPLSKTTELQDKAFTNFDKKSSKKFKNIWITIKELEKMHLKLLREREIDSSISDHHLIETDEAIIGLIISGTKKEPDIHYKTKHAFRDMSSHLINYGKTDAWSLSSHVRGMFKNYINKQFGSESKILEQIPNDKIYSLCAEYHKPLGRVFNRHLLAKGQVQQIDMNRSYYNCAIGNIPTHLKEKYWHKMPTAPRNVKTFESTLVDESLIQILFELYGFALVKYDQSHLNIKTWFDGACRDKGIQYVSIPGLKYMHDKGIKLWLLQIHYSKENCDPFSKFFKTLDKELEWMGEDDSDQDQRNYRNWRMMPNMLIGGLNRKINKTKVFHTISKEEFDRFIIKCDEMDRLITKFDVRELTDEESKDIAPENIKKVEEYIIHYQDGVADHASSFNMVHWSKYVLDYQKIVMHDMTVHVCDNNINRLGCINTDSITYIGKELFDVDNDSCRPELSDDDFELLSEEERNEYVKPTMDRRNFFHIEAINMNEGIMVSNGLRYLCDQQQSIQRHSGYVEKQSKEKFLELLNHIKSYVTLPDNRDEKYIKEVIVEDYDSKLEGIKLDSQKLVTTIAPAGFGKSEIVKYMIGEPSKVSTSDIYRTYKKNEVLSATPTHQARKVLGGDTITCMGLKFSLEFYATSKLDVSKLKAIIFDEVSMMDRWEFEKLDTYLRLNIKNRPFGGLDIYLFGDFKQLSPYKGKPCKDGDYIFNSKLYDLFENNQLTKNYRQTDQPVLQSILQKIRNSYDYGGSEKSMLSSKKILLEILNDEEINMLNKNIIKKCRTLEENNIESLCYSNKIRQIENRRIHGKLRVGSNIIFRKTFKTKGIHNGDRDTITEIRDSVNMMTIWETQSNGKRKAIMKVPSEDGLEYKIGSYWFHEKYFIEPNLENKIQPVKKYPDIHLNYASTVHCTQGRTISKIIMNIYDLPINLLYVALSRATKIDNIYLKRKI